MEMSDKQPISKKIKPRAPPPPTLYSSKLGVENMTSSETEGIANQSSEESKENLLHRKVNLLISLPDGQEKPVTVDGNKAVMDFLVDLCSQNHLNPAHHILEVRSGVSQQPLILRPNTLIGTLDVETIFLKEKATEVKVRKPAPKIPEKTVRLVVNFLGTQKAVVRVNPAVPLRSILPAVCEKCELNLDNVTLLRDGISKEELDMSRSLNELGIKELYAWSGKQEKNRNFSSNSDTTEKEKKGIFGFFRSYKKGNKNEGSVANVDGDDYEEVFRTAATSGNRYEGFSTAPSSPSVNSRPIALGASLSLSNISGIGDRPEVKKRRAPPPPKPVAPVIAADKSPEDMSSETLYTTVQKEQQKKKRRAPPPPPTSQMPNEKEENLENRKSSAGDGRQVPQKPPRGNSRSPPQLMIPPPPPYPPPDNDIADPPVFENGAALKETTRPIPAKREKRLIRCNSVSSEEVLTTDDAGSVNSYTEDSGIVSSPSDSTSLDLQNYSSKRKEKAEIQVDEYKATDNNMQPARAQSFNSENLWSQNTSAIRADDEVALVKNGDEEYFIAAQFQESLAELDEDSEDMDEVDIGESNHIGTRTSPVGQESSYSNDYGEHIAAVPVTVIDEVPEINTLKYNPHNIMEVKESNNMQQSSDLTDNHTIAVVPEVDKSENKNSTIYRPHQSNSQEGKSKAENAKPVETNYTSYPSINKSKLNTSQKQYSEESPSSNIATSAPSIKESQETRPRKERTEMMSEQKEKVEIKENSAVHKVYNKPSESSKPVLWRQQTYEPKVGMTTFIVVPPKPDIKKYDREVSLSASAIKIDELGNLVNPQSSLRKKDVKDTLASEKEGPLVEKPLLEKAKEFWRSNSTESQAVEIKEHAVRKFAPHPSKSYKPNQAPENKVNSPPVVGLIQQVPGKKFNDTDNRMLQTKSATPQERMIIIENTSKGRTEVSLGKPNVHNRFNGIQQTKATQGPNENITIIENTIKGKTDQRTAVSRPNGSQQTKLVQPPAALQEKVIIIEQPNTERKDLPFLKSSKRTSSQYVASAISRYTEPVDKKSLQTSEAKLNTNCDNGNGTLKSNRNFPTKEPNVEIKAVNKQETSVDFRKNLSSSNGQVVNKNLEMEPTSKINSNCEQKETPLSEQNGFSGFQSILGNTNVTKRTNIKSSAQTESSYASRPISALPSNAFLKAVREKSVKIEQANAITPLKTTPTTVVIHEKEEKHDIDIIPSTVIDEPDSTSSGNVFGPKARFRPVVQKPMQKDSSIHSALMGAIQSGEGKEKLRKIQSSPTDGCEKKFTEPENERSALLSAIRAHDGTSRLKKISSAASNELQILRSKEMLQKDNETVITKTSVPSSPLSPPPPPPPPPPLVINAAPKSLPVSSNSSADAREALLEAIRSGAGASRLKKVPASVRTL
ncbi:protein cordon-bleu [Leptodactylus fuscus]|uniref:protein cordon-bleu n=1 Tax=Leptodactylus fuscus TaxID=238119 RepID=UPI003F4EBB62